MPSGGPAKSNGRESVISASLDDDDDENYSQNVKIIINAAISFLLFCIYLKGKVFSSSYSIYYSFKNNH